MISWLPHINVTLNAISTVLLVLGFIFIKQRKEQAHRATMMATFVTSIVFLVCYLTYHYYAGSKKFPTDTDIAPASVRYFYYALLLTHVVLAAVVPFLAVGAIYFGITDQRAAHKRVVRWAWPIWLYVSVTGVVVYLMLYQIYYVP